MVSGLSLGLACSSGRIGGCLHESVNQSSNGDCSAHASLIYNRSITCNIKCGEKVGENSEIVTL